MSEQGAIRVIGFAGSLRRGSYNRALLAAAVDLAPDTMDLVPYDVADLPLYNYDLEVQGDPQPVRALKEALEDADGLLISTPEYNHGVAGVTKNVVDWISRPARQSVLSQLPVAIMGATSGPWGTARGQAQLRQAFTFTNSFAMPQPQLLVAKAGDRFDERGRLTDERTREHLHHFLEAFVRWIAVFRGSPVQGPGS